MVKLLQMVLMVLLLHLVALTAALQQPEWAADLGLEPWTWTPWPHGLAADPQWSCPNQEELDRAEAKERVVTALLDGRLTLFEAAGHFRRLKHPLTDLRANNRGVSEEECCCRQVIEVVGLELRRRGQNETADDFTARWEEELRRHLEQHGQVILAP